MSDAAAPDFDGRVVLITGAGDGLGAALARACAAAGAEVVLLGRTVRKLEAVYDAIVAAGGPEPSIYPLDLEGATPEDYAELAERIGESLGRLDALVHNAAMLGAQTPIEHYPPLEWARVLQVNLNAPMLLTQVCLPLLRASGRGSVVFVGDERRSAYWGAYGVSKAAVSGLADMLADELDNDPDLAVHQVRPGPMQTGFRTRAFPGALRSEAPPPEEALGPLLAAIAGRR
ncbi:MAG: SDR family NAD(P)-dependent oxidoreductase [Halofilum sp. (in: g-proteobacteria)]